MQIRIIGATTIKGDGRVNEDTHGAAASAAWVVDGATGVAPAALFGASDAAWYAETFGAALAAALAEFADADTRSIAAGVIRNVRDRYLSALDAGASPENPPSAAFAMIRAVGGGVEASALGDCAVLYRHAGGDVRRFTSHSVADLEAATRAMLKTAQAAFPTAAPAEILEKLKPHIRKARKLMNTVDGYWILSIHEAAAAHIAVETLAAAPDAPILLMSDGFSRLVDVFNATDDAGLYDAVLKEGPEALAEQLRKLEAADAGCRRYARVKTSDDATCVVVSAA